MSWAGCQIDPIGVNFHLQKSLEIFDKNSADKIWSKKDKEIKVSPLIPIRVNIVHKFLAVKEVGDKTENASYERISPCWLYVCFGIMLKLRSAA